MSTGAVPGSAGSAQSCANTSSIPKKTNSRTIYFNGIAYNAEPSIQMDDLKGQNTVFLNVINSAQHTSDAKLIGESKEPSCSRRKRGRKPIDKSAFYCHHCGIKSTPEWRQGPDGKHTLCNACGLFYSSFKKRDQKRNKSDHFSFILNPNPHRLKSENNKASISQYRSESGC